MRKLILISDSGCDALRLISLSMVIYETLIFFLRNAESIKDNNLIFPAFQNVQLCRGSLWVRIISNTFLF